MASILNLLIVEDLTDDARLLLLELQAGGWDVKHQRVANATAMTAALDAQSWDIIISDYSMPSFSGLEALALVRQRAVDVPFILVSGTVGEEIAVQAMKAGANDYLFKGNFKRLVPAVQRELREYRARSGSRELQRELQRRDRQLADAHRLARLGSWHLDFAANSAVWSEEVYRILGLDPGNTTATIDQFLSFIHADDRHLFTDAWSSANTQQFSGDCRILRPDGITCYVHIRGDIVSSADGKPLESTGMIQDITERKLTEQALRAAHDDLAVAKEAADVANRTKDHFLAILSHELRTPLTPILALVSLWEMQPDMPPELRRQSNIIRRNVQMEARLIDDLLDLTAIVHDKIELHYEVLDTHALLLSTIQSLQKQIEAHALQVEVKLQAKQYYIWADPIRLRQVFDNLISNAVKFTPAGGKISIHSDNVEQARLKIQIRDNGIGITSDVLPGLFKDFQQGERTITRRFGGLGLGLSIAKSMIEMHKGTITAESAGRNEGTTLTIYLDTIPPEEAEPQAIATPDSQTALKNQVPSNRVLLVEDHDDTRNILSKLLTILGCTVTSAESVHEAMELATNEKFDVLVSDLGLPDGSGNDVIKFIKNLYQIRGIAISGFGQEEDLRRSDEAGFEMHLTKPIDFKMLQNAIEGVAI